MQYSVPQFIEVEDKIIGPLGLKQFLILLGGGLVSLLWWSIFGPGLIFFFLALPTMGLFAFVAFGKFNGRPVLSNLASAVKFFAVSKVRVFQRSGEQDYAVKKAPEQQAATPVQPAALVESRLRTLAYFLDQKSAEEQRLVHSGQMRERWLNQI